MHKCCPFQLLSEGTSLISTNLMFPAFPPLPNTATVTGCIVWMLWWLGPRHKKLSHLAHCFHEGVGISRASTQHVQQSPGPHSHRGCVVAHPAQHHNRMEKSREDLSRGDMANRSSKTPGPQLLGTQPKKERKYSEKKIFTSSSSLLSLQPAYTVLKSHYTSRMSQIWDKSC